MLLVLVAGGTLRFRQTTPLDSSRFVPEVGRAFVYRISIARSDSDGGRSTLTVLEDGRAIGPAHANHSDIRKIGAGRFSHWGGSLYFSTPDVSDPRRNSRRYAVEHDRTPPAWSLIGLLAIGGLCAGASSLSPRLAWKRGVWLGVTFVTAAIVKGTAGLAALGHHPGRAGSLLVIGSFLGLATALAQAGWTLAVRRPSLPTEPTSQRGSRLFIGGLWLAASAAALALWPDALDASKHPYTSLVLLGTLFALPAVAAERQAVSSRFVASYFRATIGAGLLLAVAASIQYGINVRPVTEGVDFYYYVTSARDAASGARDVPLVRYQYFPGVYTFWRLALWIGGGGLSGLQWSYLVVLSANAILVGGAVFRVTSSPFPALVAALWYALLCSRLEGFYGVTEPLVTLPLLAGLVVWGGRPLNDRRGLARAVALGAAIGLAAYMKQLGGLLAAGCLALAIANVAVGARRPHPLRHLAAIPLAAALTFLSGILLEGHGFEPLKIGLAAAGVYHSEGSFASNLLAASRPAFPVTIAAIIPAAVWIALVTTPRWRWRLSLPWAAMSGFCLLAGSATVVQYARRGYNHYSLLGAPFIVAAIVITCVALVRGAPLQLQKSVLCGYVVAGIATIPFVRQDAWPHLSFWPPPLTSPVTAHQKPWRTEPDVDSDLNALRSLVAAGEDVLLLPPRQNEVHFFLGTRSISFEEAYSWGRPDPYMATRAVRSPSLDAVVVFNRFVDPRSWKWLGCDAAVLELPKAGFQKVGILKTMTVWRRRAPGAPRRRDPP